jgi:F0F1-type ATP synthase assembly protein I
VKAGFVGAVAVGLIIGTVVPFLTSSVSYGLIIWNIGQFLLGIFLAISAIVIGELEELNRKLENRGDEP